MMSQEREDISDNFNVDVDLNQEDCDNSSLVIQSLQKRLEDITKNAESIELLYNQECDLTKTLQERLYSASEAHKEVFSSIKKRF